MIPLFTTFPQLGHLYRQCVAQPGEDTVRLAFRDHLEECAEDSPEHRSALRDWAELFRVQYRLKEIGPPPLTLVEDATLERKGGYSYFQTQVDDDTKVVVGDRVTIHLCSTWARFKELNPVYHRLLVRKVAPGGQFGKTLTLVRDADSTPYPGIERGDLLNRSYEISGRNLFWGMRQDCRWLGGSRPVPGVVWDRGLPSIASPPRISFDMTFWLDAAVLDFPISDVRFQVRPHLRWRWLPKALEVRYTIDPDAVLEDRVRRNDVRARAARTYDEADRIHNEVLHGPEFKTLLAERWPAVCNWHLPD